MLTTPLKISKATLLTQKYADDDKLIKKLREGSFSGGLKWDYRRCMYVIDLDNPENGIQILQLSFSQYKDLEERKLNLWAKLNRNGKNVPCPISSISSAFPVEITRKTENGKASYSFNIDTVADKSELEESTLQQLIDMPRLPEQVYRYTRYHLEATIAYLTQLDAKFDIEVMDSQEVQDCIAQIKMLLPADDQSHFTLSDKGSDDNDGVMTIEALWKKFDALCDDQTEEGQDLRSEILAFIDTNKLNVKVNRKKTNEDILNEIEDELNGVDGEVEEEPTPKKPARKSIVEDEDYDDDSEPATPSDEEDDDEPEEAPVVSRRRERNDDTNEPAARVSRRGARPPRRRE